MSLHEQSIGHQFTCAGVEEWFLSLDSFGFALACSWRGLVSDLRPGGAIRDIEQGLRRVVRQLNQVLLDLVVEGLKQRDAVLARPHCPKCLQTHLRQLSRTLLAWESAPKPHQYVIGVLRVPGIDRDSAPV